jgi:TPR repeat protein
LPLDQIEYVLSTIIGNNGTKSKGGLIQKSYDLKRLDLADKFYVQTKLLIKKAEDNFITLPSVRGYLIDVVEYYRIDDNKDYINSLRDKHYIESFKSFKEGAEGGNRYSMKMLSEYYREGKGCVENLEKAKYWELKSNEK